MRSVPAVLLLVLGVLSTTWGTAVVVLLTRSPDSDLAVGALYGGPFLLAGLGGVLVGAHLLRSRRS